MAKAVITLKDNKTHTISLENNLRVSYEGLTATIENCLELGTGKLSGNTETGSCTQSGKLCFSNDQIKSINIIF